MKNLTIHKRAKQVVLLSLLIISTLFVFAACNNSTAEAQDTASNNIHKTAAVAEPLSEVDKVLDIEGYGASGALADTELSIVDMLMYAMQDEYLAHSEYELIIDKFGEQNPYVNIMAAEENHIVSLTEIYTAYGLSVPEDISDEYVVIPDSLLEAAKTGVQAEIDNIAMYERFLGYDLPEDIKIVFESLKAASENHLEAFERQVDKLS
jgi:hypothetical protein